MKTILLLGAAVIAGAVRYPIEGPQVVHDDEADRLVENGFASHLDEGDDSNTDADRGSDDGLDKLTLIDLGLLVTKEGVALNGVTKKDDIISAIRADRSAKA